MENCFRIADIIDTVDKLIAEGKAGNRDAWDVALNELPTFGDREISDPVRRDVIFINKENLNFRPAKIGWLIRLLHRVFGWSEPTAA